MAAEMKALNSLKEALEKEKVSLKGLDDNIKKLTGREPKENEWGPNRRPFGGENRGPPPPRLRRDRVVGPGQRRDSGPGQGPTPLKRRLTDDPPSDQKRSRPDVDSGEEEDLPRKPTIPSSIVTTQREPKSKDQVIAEQKKDEQQQKRNRRFFGFIMGTLQKFQVEAKVTEGNEKMKHRRELEKKYEQQWEEEREVFEKQKTELIGERRKYQKKIRRMESKMDFVRYIENWAREQRKMSNFIKTKAKPPIFFRPKVLVDLHEHKRKRTAEEIEEEINKRMKQAEEEVQKMMLREQQGVDDTQAAVDSQAPGDASIVNVPREHGRRGIDDDEEEDEEDEDAPEMTLRDDALEEGDDIESKMINETQESSELAPNGDSSVKEEIMPVDGDENLKVEPASEPEKGNLDEASVKMEEDI